MGMSEITRQLASASSIWQLAHGSLYMVQAGPRVAVHVLSGGSDVQHQRVDSLLPVRACDWDQPGLNARSYIQVVGLASPWAVLRVAGSARAAAGRTQSACGSTCPKRDIGEGVHS